MMEQTAETHTIENIQDNFHKCIADSEEYVRQNPAKSSLIAIGIGLLLAQLPLRWILLVLIKLALLVIKPVTFIYAISKLIDDIRSARHEHAE